MNTRYKRNVNVERAVTMALERIDYFLAEGELNLPEPKNRRACDNLINNQSASTITACLFLTFYKLIDPTYNFARQPVGARGKHGDKWFCEELSKRSVTLHNNIKAYFENIGSKGEVKNFNPARDSRYKDYLRTIKNLLPEELSKMA